MNRKKITKTPSNYYEATKNLLCFSGRKMSILNFNPLTSDNDKVSPYNFSDKTFRHVVRILNLIIEDEFSRYVNNCFLLYQEEPNNLQLVGLLAQLVEHCTGITGVKSSNSVHT